MKRPSPSPAHGHRYRSVLAGLLLLPACTELADQDSASTSASEPSEGSLPATSTGPGTTDTGTGTGIGTDGSTGDAEASTTTESSGGASSSSTSTSSSDETTGTGATSSDEDSGTDETSSTSDADVEPGELLWSDNFDAGAQGADALRSVMITEDGSHYAAGEGLKPWQDGDVGGIVLLRYSPDGQLLWERFFSGLYPAADFALALHMNAAGQLEAVGRREIASGSYAWLGRFDADQGFMIEEFFLDAEHCRTCTATTLTSRSQTRSVALLHDSGMPDYGLKLVDFGPKDDGELPAIPLDVSGHIQVASAALLGSQLYVAGQLSQNSERNFWLGRINPKNELESELHPQFGVEGRLPRLTGIASDGEDLYAVGDVLVDGDLTRTMIISRLSPEGEPRWVRPLSNMGFAQAIALTRDHRLVVTGRRVSEDDGGDIWLGVWDDDGRELWTRSFDGPGKSNDHAYGLTVDPRHDAAVIVGYLGVADDPIRGRDAWIGRIKL